MTMALKTTLGSLMLNVPSSMCPGPHLGWTADRLTLVLTEGMPVPTSQQGPASSKFRSEVGNRGGDHGRLEARLHTHTSQAAQMQGFQIWGIVKVRKPRSLNKPKSDQFGAWGSFGLHIPCALLDDSYHQGQRLKASRQLTEQLV